jgi:RNA polymerase sigma factor (sigma-70 family)
MHRHSLEVLVAQNGLTHLLKYLHRRSLGHAGGLPDSALLDRYVQSRDEAAFELLVWRHGSLVLNLCRRVLRNDHDVDDAFQATFATLACKARSIRAQGSVAPWLYKVAYRTALTARSRSRRHVGLERAAEPLAANDDDLLWRDLRAVLDSEIHRLSAKHRDAVVLCYLQGLTHAEAAARLGCPEGTVHSRLATAKEKLRRGLERRGVPLSGTGMALEFATRHAAVAPGVDLVQKTLTTVGVISGSSLAGTTSQTSAIALTRGVLLTMWMQSFAAPALVAIAMSVAWLGFGAVGWQTKTDQSAQNKAVPTKVMETQNKANEIKPPLDDNDFNREALRVQELEEKRKELQKAQNALMTERVELEHSNSMLSGERFAQESALRKLERTSRLALDRAEKNLASLEEEEITVAKQVRTAAYKLGAKDLELQRLEEHLKEVRKLIQEKTEEIERLEQQSFEQEFKLKDKAARDRPGLQINEKLLHQVNAIKERHFEMLQEALEAIELKKKFPKLGQILKEEGNRVDNNRVEAKLDQILLALADLKKQLAKP